MQFRFFRFLLMVFSLACAILSVWALVGSYKNADYLTQNYLIDFHLTGLDLSKLINLDDLSTRDLGLEEYIPSSTTKRDWLDDGLDNLGDAASSAASSVASSVDSVSSDVSGGVNSVLKQILSKYSNEDLGLADVYTVSLWGYCKGDADKDNKNKGTFDNSKLNITYCSKPKLGYKFDPLTLFKHEVNNTINDKVDGSDDSNPISKALSSTVKNALEDLVDNIDYDSLDLPSDLNKKITLVNNLTKAGAALILTAAVLSFISIFIQCAGCFLSPDNCCLSFLNFLFEVVILIIALVGAAILTGAYMEVRKKINDETKEYGIRSFLSIQFYAFIWSAVVAAIIVCLLNLLGHCCGLFRTGRKRYRTVSAAPPPADREMGYDHKEGDSDVSSKH